MVESTKTSDNFISLKKTSKIKLRGFENKKLKVKLQKGRIAKSNLRKSILW